MSFWIVKSESVSGYTNMCVTSLSYCVVNTDSVRLFYKVNAILLVRHNYKKNKMYSLAFFNEFFLFLFFFIKHCNTRGININVFIALGRITTTRHWLISKKNHTDFKDNKRINIHTNPQSYFCNAAGQGQCISEVSSEPLPECMCPEIRFGFLPGYSHSAVWK